MNYNRIFHISDIHIRPLARHEEYLIVFDRLYKSMIKKGVSSPQSLIVFTGDLFHEKDRLKPETVALARNFLKNLVKICGGRVIIICGNHDLVENNEGRMDNLTAIVDDIDVDYLKYTGHYNYNNICFTVSSVIDKKNISFPHTDNRNKIKIALFHGMVDFPSFTSSTDIRGATGRELNSKYFDGFDYVLLGDVHKGGYVLPTPLQNIAYAGSLIQQNFGETLTHHGYLIWDLDKRARKFVEIKNDYGYFNIYEETDISKVPWTKNSRIRIWFQDYDQSWDKKISLIKEKTNIISLDKREIFNSISPNQLPHQEMTVDSDDTHFLINEWSRVNGSNNDLEWLKKTHADFKKSISQSTVSDISLGYWRIKSLEFKNMFIYGGNKVNKLDFTSTNSGNFGILGNNAIGKSCILRIILFALFERCGPVNKSFERSRVITRGTNSCYTSITIQSGDTLYKITRNGKRRTRANKESSEFKTTIENLTKKINLNAEDNRKTNQIIHDLLNISYEDFVLCCVYSQSIGYSLLDASETERIEIFNRFLKLDWYQQITKLVKQKVKEIKNNITFNNGKISAINNNIDSLSSRLLPEPELKKLEEELKKLTTLINSMNTSTDITPPDLSEEQIDEELKKLPTPPPSNLNTSDILELKLKIIKIDKTEEQIKNELSVLRASYKDSDSDSDSSIKSTTMTREDLVEQKIKLEFATSQIKSMTACDIKSEQKLLDDLAKCETFNISFKNEPPKVDKPSLTNLPTTQEELNAYANQYFRYKCRQIYDNSTHRLIIKSKLRYIEYLKNTSLIKNYITHIHNLEIDSQIKKLEKGLKIIQTNNSINQRIRQIELIDMKTKWKLLKKSSNNSHYQDKLTTIKEKITQQKIYQNELKTLSQEHTTITETINDQTQLFNKFSLYLKIVDKNGMPFQIAQEKISHILKIVNRYLKQFVNFSIDIIINTTDIKPKFTILIKKQNLTLNIEDISGYESFVLRVGLKMALSKANFIGKCDTIMIDEGLDCIDSNNFKKLGNLLDYVKNHFNKVLLITHINEIEKYIDYKINIIHSNNCSEIKK